MNQATIDGVLLALALFAGLVAVGSLTAVVTVAFVAASRRRATREAEQRGKAYRYGPFAGPLTPVVPGVRMLPSRRPPEPAKPPFRGKEGATVDPEGGTFQHTTGTSATGVVTASDLGFARDEDDVDTDPDLGGKGEKGSGKS